MLFHVLAKMSGYLHLIDKQVEKIPLYFRLTKKQLRTVGSSTFDENKTRKLKNNFIAAAAVVFINK